MSLSGITAADKPTLKLTPLGGVGRFGRNCLLVEDVASGVALVVDCGVRFAGPELPGFEVGLPDLERLAAVGDRLLAFVVTHGHEDHIGALPFALRDRPRTPVLCTSFTARFVERRCERFGVAPVLDVVGFGEARALGPFSASFRAVSHSIPGAASLVLDTPVGVVVHSGDFRVDNEPVLGPPTDLEGLKRAAGPGGVACLLADSTGARIPGRNPGERSVEALLERCFVDAALAPWPGLVVVTLFASHLQRLALLVELCRRHGRRLLLLGRGIKETVRMALAEGVLAGDDVFIDESGARALPRHRLCVAVTGSQGEADAMLARLARATTSTEPSHLPVVVQRGDRVVFSARVIPGNEHKVQPLVDAFVDVGADVIEGHGSPHVSGHGHAEDLRMLLAATRPRLFVALHGNPQHLVAHGALARELGVEGVVGLRDGHTLVVQRDGADVVCAHVQGERAREPAARGPDVAWFPRGIADARRRMQSAGVVVVVVAADGEVRLAERGVFPSLLEDGELLPRVKDLLREAVRDRGEVDDVAVRAVARAFSKVGRPPPEVLVVPPGAVS